METYSLFRPSYFLICDMIIRECKLCGKDQPHRQRVDRPSTISWCLKCENLKQRGRDHRDKQHWVDKLGGECHKCGRIDHCCIYDFHHIDPAYKTAPVSKVSKYVRKYEVNKCKLLCGICHRKHVHKSDVFMGKDDTIKPCVSCGNEMPHRLKKRQRGNFYSHKCRQCENHDSMNRKRHAKKLAVEYLGGECLVCGLIDDPEVYDFHHRDPTQKDFKVSSATNFEKCKTELQKCDLLCCLCHRKLHAGVLESSNVDSN